MPSGRHGFISSAAEDLLRRRVRAEPDSNGGSRRRDDPALARWHRPGVEDAMNREARARAVVDERLFAAYWASVDHFGTTDLVLYFDTDRREDPVDAFVRTRLLADANIPGPLSAKISKPAKDAATTWTGAGTAFWLVVSFPDEEMIVSAVVAQRAGQGGTA
jgi:hypothetical protein